MAGKALPVIRGLQARFSHVLAHRRHFVTTLARGMLRAFRREVVADRAAGRHLSHIRMALVVKRNG
jgi:hypothetical protein